MTLKQVAAEAGVSTATASLVLRGLASGRASDDVAARVNAAAAALGYQPNLTARSLRSGSTKTIGLLSDDVATTPFAGRMIAGAQDAAWNRGWMVFIVDAAGNPDVKDRAIRAFQQRNVEGLVYAEMYHQLVAPPTPNMPLVLLDCREAVPTGDLSSVVPDETAGGYAAAKHLLDQGHRRLAYLTTGENTVARVLRAQGFELAVATVPDAEAFTFLGGNSDAGGGREAMIQALAASPRPTAIFCYTDRMAMGAYSAIADAGLRVPDDISVVGFDNQPFLADALVPPLTSVELPHYDMGAWAVNKLIDVLEATEAPHHEQVRLAGPVVVRESVAPPRPNGREGASAASDRTRQ